MSYVALYRKWRPDTFTEVKGQEHIVTTLKNQISYSRIGHAYLFCGTRGTGKTTLAKIMAKAANCEHPIDGNPCNECESCKRISSGQATNVVEIDAASNNGVDNIRQIQNAVNYSPSDSKYLVYIIDEVHMLSAGAFNALLKTLEEPPEYVIFILATTEAHKIPATISSRCQHYDFKRIPRETISNRLQELLDREEVPADKDALDYIAGAADGSMRDALSILDQCIAFNLGERLTYDRVLDTVGSVNIDIYIKLLRAIYDEDVKTALEIVDQATYDGKDLTQFANELIVFMRNVLMLKLDPLLKVELTSENIARLIELGSDMDENYLIDCINSMQEAAAKINAAYVKKVMLEIAIIKLCKPQMQKGDGALEKRLLDLESQSEKLEDKIASAIANIPVSALQLNQNANTVQGTNQSVDMQTSQGSSVSNADTVSSQSEDVVINGVSMSSAQITAKVMQNIQSKYPEAKVYELKMICAMHEYIAQHLAPPAALYFRRAALLPSSDQSRLDLVIEEKSENKAAINYFKTDKFIDALKVNIAGIVERKVDINFRVVAPGGGENAPSFWDVSKMNIDGVTFEVKKTTNS